MMIKITFRRMAILVLGLYFLVTCYTGYMVIRRKLERATEGNSMKEGTYDKGSEKVLVDDSDWNPWGQEFEKEHQKLPAFERPHLVLDSDANTTKPEEKTDERKLLTKRQEPEHVIEIWGKAAIGLYLWEHIFHGHLESRLGGIWSYGSVILNNLEFRFRTGPGVVPDKVPQDTVNLVLVVNGRAKDKIDFATMWLEYLPNLPKLQNVAVVMLGDERCNNRWIYKYTTKYGGPVKVVFLVYDSPEIDDENFYQWPLGVATYRNFPHVSPGELDANAPRSYVCNFLGSLYPNSSRSVLVKTLQSSNQQSYCYVRARLKWMPNESSQTREEYIEALKQSDLTLNPVGQNTECYRIYEAMSLGSVPVVEDRMTEGDCGGRKPYPLRILKQYQAPIIYVSDWTKIDDLLKSEKRRSKEDIVHRRERVLKWYADFLDKIKQKFVNIINQKFFVGSR